MHTLPRWASICNPSPRAKKGYLMSEDNAFDFLKVYDVYGDLIEGEKPDLESSVREVLVMFSVFDRDPEEADLGERLYPGNNGFATYSGKFRDREQRTQAEAVAMKSYMDNLLAFSQTNDTHDALLEAKERGMLFVVGVWAMAVGVRDYVVLPDSEVTVLGTKEQRALAVEYVRALCAMNKQSETDMFIVQFKNALDHGELTSVWHEGVISLMTQATLQNAKVAKSQFDDLFAGLVQAQGYEVVKAHAITFLATSITDGRYSWKASTLHAALLYQLIFGLAYIEEKSSDAQEDEGKRLVDALISDLSGSTTRH